MEAGFRIRVKTVEGWKYLSGLLTLTSSTLALSL